MSEDEQGKERRDQHEQGHDQDALDQQEGKGYGEDEGEREQALEER